MAFFKILYYYYYYYYTGWPKQSATIKNYHLIVIKIVIKAGIFINEMSTRIQ